MRAWKTSWRKRAVFSSEHATVEAAGGCDYLFFGTVFRSASKPAHHDIAGVQALAAVCNRVQLPVIAIGGVSLTSAPQVMGAGAAGVAAISLFADAHDIAATVRDLHAALTLHARP